MYLRNSKLYVRRTTKILFSSIARKVTAGTAKVKWDSKSAVEVYNQYRALRHLHPLTTYWFDQVVKILDVELDNVTQTNPENERCIIREYGTKDVVLPGLVEYSQRRSLLRVQCKDGKWVCIRSLIISGKKQLTAGEFNNGFLTKVKDSLHRKFEFR